MLHFDSIAENKERLTNTFPGYHSKYHNLFQKFVSFAVQAFRLHIFLGTIEINSIVLAISWCLKGKVLLIFKKNRVSVIFLIKFWTTMRKHSKFGSYFQILYAFQPFSLKSFSMAAIYLSVKTILLHSSETFERRPVTSTDFDLHCNGFLHCPDFFIRQRRKKTN